MFSFSEVSRLPVYCFREELKLIKSLKSSWSGISTLISRGLELSITEFIPDETQHLLRIFVFETVTIRLYAKLKILVCIAIDSVHTERYKCIIDSLLIMWWHSPIILTTDYNHSSLTCLKITEGVDQWRIIVIQFIQLL